MKKYNRIFKEEKDIQSMIIQFFKDNPNPSDDEFHAFVESKGISPHDAETEVYKIISDILHSGHSKGVKPQADDIEFELGRKVEMEHTTIPEIADKIIWDHLTENPKYYTEGKAKGIFSEL